MTHPIEAIYDQIPPSSLPDEQAAIGSCLLEPAVIPDVAAIVSPCDFYGDANRRVFGAMVAMSTEDEPISVITLHGRLKTSGQLEAVGGSAYLAELAQSVAVHHHALHHARIVRHNAKLRHLRQIGFDLAVHAHNAQDAPDDVLDAAESKLSSMRFAGEKDPVRVAEAALEALARIDEIRKRGGSAGLATGLFSFDEKHGGLFPGELTVLAARPGCGKTSLALQISAHNAGKDRPVYFASLEMSAVELTIKLGCSASGVSSQRVRTGTMSYEESAKLAEAMNQQAGMALDIHDRAGMTVAEIRRQVRKRKKTGLSLAVVDYLQLVQPEDRHVPREQQVARIVRQLKELAREHEIPVLCLCQLNRQADEGVPRLSQLRESGAIEQDADVVLFLSQHQPTTDSQHNAVLTVAKNRNGETGHLRLDWDGPRTRFSCYGSNNWDEDMDHDERLESAEWTG